MRLIGGLCVLGASYLIGRHAGVAGFFLAWLLIGVGVMGGGIGGLFLSLPRLARKATEYDEPVDEAHAKRILERHMSRYMWPLALVGGSVGALVALVVV